MRFQNEDDLCSPYLLSLKATRVYLTLNTARLANCRHFLMYILKHIHIDVYTGVLKTVIKT